MAETASRTNDPIDFEKASADLEGYLQDPSRYPDPYPIYAALRETHPVHRNAGTTWVVLRYDEGQTVLVDQDRFSRERAVRAMLSRIPVAGEAAEEALATYLSFFVNLDDPEHLRLRKLVSRAFSLRALERWDEIIADVVADLVERLEGREQFDFFDEFAKAVPSHVICDMVGVPRADHKIFEKWMSAMVRNAVQANSSFLETIGEFADYMYALIAERKRVRLEKTDLVSLLLDAEEEGSRITEREVVASLMMLITAGHETTGNLIANGALALLTNPDQLALIAENPGLADAAVDETLRYDSPARSLPRMATQDVEIGGVTMRAGDMVQVHLGAVNRDPAVFDDPDRFDLNRGNRKLQLGFGKGTHFCLGHNLARMEARQTFVAVASRLGRLEVAGDLAWRNTHVRSLVALPVVRR
jgi:cytochrome P450